MMEGSIDTQINNILSNVPGAVSFMAEANKTRSAYRYTQPAAGAAAGGVFSVGLELKNFCAIRDAVADTAF